MKSSADRLLLGLHLAATAGAVVLGLLFALGYATGALGLLSQGLTLSHLRAALATPPFWVSLGYSLVLTTVTMALALALALAGLLSLRERLARPPLSLVLVLPLAWPPILAALVSDQLLGGAGLLSRLGHHLGWVDAPNDFPALVQDRTGIGIVLTHAALVTPFFLLLFHRLAEREDLTAYLALARSLGASAWQCAWRVATPLLLRGTAPLVAVYAVALLGAYEVPLLVGARYPAMLAVEIEQQLAQMNLALRPRGYAMAAGYLLLVVAGWALLAMRATRRHGR